MSDIKSTFMNITKSLTKTSGDIVKNTKLNMDLANAEDELKQIYIELGKKVHEIYAYGGSLGTYFDEKYDSILKAQANIDDIKNQIDTIKGVKICAKCGKGVERKAEFCPSCGSKMDDNISFVDTAAPAPAQTIPANTEASAKNEVSQPKSVHCPACGSENEPESKFCLSCGRIL